jgi:hypothetical protein
MAEAAELAPGDVVIARFTERGKSKTVRAHVTAVNAKRGKVEINWVHTSASGGDIGWSQRTKWVALADVRKVEKKPGELAPNEMMRGIVGAMAGKDVDLG